MSDLKDGLKPVVTEIDFIAWDNSNPPQLWGWIGEPGDEASEAIFRLPSAGMGDENRLLEAANQHLLQRCDRLQAELQADAERYQWLRNNFAQMHSPKMDGSHCWRFRGHSVLVGRTLDAAIDAAREDE